MTDPIDELLSEFADLTAAGRPARPELGRRRRPLIASVIGTTLVVLVIAAVGFVVFGTRPAQPPVSAASPIPSAVASGPPTTNPSGAPSSTPSSANLACTSILGNIPFVRVTSGEPTLVASFEVTGHQFAAYLPSLAHTDGGVGEFDWQHTGPSDEVDVCFIDGDLITEDPGPPHDISAVRVLVGISNGEAQLVAFARHDPSVLPIVDPSSTTPSTPPAPTGMPPIQGGFPNWAPDGQHMIVDGPVNTGKQIRDASGAYIAGLADSFEADWVDSSTIESRTLDGREITLYDVTGHEISVIPGEYESALAAPGKRILALTEYATHGLAQGSRYKIWNDGTLSSAWQDGRPIVWSRDGTRLLILHPTDVPAFALGGTLSIVDVNGTQLSSVGDWTSSSTDSYAFSPDGRYLAACLADLAGADEALRVVDTVSGSVTKVADGPCVFFLQWSPEPKLYIADANNKVVTWTPTEGVVDSGLPDKTIVSVAPDGTLATWIEGDATVQVHLAEGVVDYGLAGPIDGVSWSPDSRSFAVGSNGYLTLITPGVTPPSTGPTPVPTPSPSPTPPPQQTTADDGTNWSVVSFDPLMTMAIGSVSSIDAGFVAVGTYCDNSKENCLLTSSDGLSWKRVDVDGMPNGPGELPQVIHTHGLWVAGSAFDGYHGAALWTSPDGTSWDWAGQADAFSPPDCASATDAKANIYELYATDRAIVAEGQYECAGKPGSRQTWQSGDGTTWEPVDAAYQMFEVSKSNGVYLGKDQNGAIRWSSDGLTWSAPVDISHRPDIVDNFDVTSIANGFIGVTTSSPGMPPHRVITSSDGQTWTDQPNPLGTAGTEAPSSDGSRAVMIEDDSASPGAVWVSTPDGTQWSHYDLPNMPGAHAASVAIVGNTIVVVGDTGDGSSVLWVTEVASAPQ